MTMIIDAPKRLQFSYLKRALRQLNRADERSGLVHCFGVFTFRSGIRHDAAAGLNVSLIALRNESTDRDAGVQIVAEVHIHDSAGVHSAPRGFELVDNFHGAYFRGS